MMCLSVKLYFSFSFFFTFLKELKIKWWNEKGNFTRRFISLIFAGWIPHDILFVGESLSLEARVRPQPGALKKLRGLPFIE